jgi:hypothetical protein
MSEKPLIWLGDSRDTIRAFPDDVRKMAGFQLWRVQRGLEPNDWKPMPTCLREADAADAECRPGPREATPARADHPAGAPEGIDHP